MRASSLISLLVLTALSNSVQAVAAPLPPVPTKTVTTGGREYATFIFSPQSNDPGWTYGTGLRATIIPRKVAESETRFFPLAEGYLNKNFLKYLQWRNALGFLYVQNYLSTGISVVVRRKWFSVSVGESVAVWGGMFNTSGFDAISATVITNPAFSFGINLRQHAYWLPDSLSLTYRLNILHNRYVKLGNSVFQERNYIFEGYSLLFMAEYYTGNGLGGGIYLGFQVNHAKPGYEFWLAFSDYDRFFNYLTFFAGYRF